jgi:hypothetical protein
VGCGWDRELVLQLDRIFHRIRINSPTSYFVFQKLVHVGFALKGHAILAIKCFEN